MSRTKPIVAVKSGRSDSGTRAAKSHTAAAASSDVVVSALFRQAGIIRVDTLEDLLDTAQVLASQPLPAGNRVAIIGNSGGPGILAADACEGAGLDVRPFTDETDERLRKLLGPNAAVANPVDMIASATPDQYEAVLRIVLAEDDIDSVIVIYTPPMVSSPDEIAAAIAAGAAEATKPIVANFLGSRLVPDALRGTDTDRRIPSFPSPEPAAITLGRITRYAEWRDRDPGTVPQLDDIDRAAARRLVDAELARIEREGAEGWLDLDVAARLLSAYGIPVVPTERVRDEGEATAAAGRCGYPVAPRSLPGRSCTNPTQEACGSDS